MTCISNIALAGLANWFGLALVCKLFKYVIELIWFGYILVCEMGWLGLLVLVWFGLVKCIRPWNLIELHCADSQFVFGFVY